MLCLTVLFHRLQKIHFVVYRLVTASLPGIQGVHVFFILVVLTVAPPSHRSSLYVVSYNVLTSCMQSGDVSCFGSRILDSRDFTFLSGSEKRFHEE